VGITHAEDEATARRLAEKLSHLRALGAPVEPGRFRAQMEVELVNDGPVTIVLDV
jgi:D-tyrosyl-tRNA(Tyr) deacylase